MSNSFKQAQAALRKLIDRNAIDGVSYNRLCTELESACHDGSFECVVATTEAVEDNLCKSIRDKSPRDGRGYIAASKAITKENSGPIGWVCPKCGAGNSPDSNRCPCVPIPVGPATR